MDAKARHNITQVLDTIDAELKNAAQSSRQMREGLAMVDDPKITPAITLTGLWYRGCEAARTAYSIQVGFNRLTRTLYAAKTRNRMREHDDGREDG